MTGQEMTNRALSHLPERLARACKSSSALYGGRINEIRLRRDMPVSLTVRGENIVLNTVATSRELEETVRSFCESSLYSHEDTIPQGFISSRDGFRVGLCGRAVMRNGKISSVADISSLNIRIPERVIGCADGAYEIMGEENFTGGMLVWSSPGVGKTTLLRELAVKLSTGKDPRRVALVDTRHELSAGITEQSIIDVLLSYPRDEGIQIAKRTLAAQVVICDEISGDEDAEALLDAHNAGICVVCSAHASCIESLLSSKTVRRLHAEGVFSTYYGLLAQEKGSFRTRVQKRKDMI